MLKKFERLLFPNNCQICKKLIEEEKFGCICENCWKKIKLIPTPRCMKCSKNIPDVWASEGLCFDCRKKKFYFDEIVSPAYYENEMKEIIHCFKYKGRWKLKKYLAALIFENINSLFWDADFLVPVPLHYNREKKRGYNQSAEIAKELSLLTGLPVRENIIIRIKETLPQITLEKEARISNISDAFAIRKKILNKRIIIVDDVFTSGSTINECARVLRNLAPIKIKAVTVARGA